MPAADSLDNPIDRAAYQEKVFRELEQFPMTAKYWVPQSYIHQPLPSNQPIIGWTVQDTKGSATPFRPYAPTETTPDWTGDPNPVGAGAYDMNPVVRDHAFDPRNQAPIGGAVYDGYTDDGGNPNALNEDVGGQLEGFEEY